MNRSAGGLGDISLLVAYKLIDSSNETTHSAISLRGQLKLPTGNSGYFFGSGGTDFAMFLSGSINYKSEWGTVGGYASAGVLVTSNGDILKNQRENITGFGNIGLGWSPFTWLGLKAQFDLNTQFYRNSSLPELGSGSAMLTIGGSIKLPDNYIIDIGVSEDIAVSTAPDVSIFMGLSKKF